MEKIPTGKHLCDLFNGADLKLHWETKKRKQCIGVLFQVNWELSNSLPVHKLPSLDANAFLWPVSLRRGCPRAVRPRASWLWNSSHAVWDGVNVDDGGSGLDEALCLIDLTTWFLMEWEESKEAHSKKKQRTTRLWFAPDSISEMARLSQYRRSNNHKAGYKRGINEKVLIYNLLGLDWYKGLYECCNTTCQINHVFITYCSLLTSISQITKMEGGHLCFPPASSGPLLTSSSLQQAMKINIQRKEASICFSHFILNFHWCWIGGVIGETFLPLHQLLRWRPADAGFPNVWKHKPQMHKHIQLLWVFTENLFLCIRRECINLLQVFTLTGPILKANGEDASYSQLILCVEKESYHRESG